MELSVYKIDGTESGKKVVLNDAIFGIKPNDHAIYLDVKQYLANQRQGTAKTKDRSEVAYSTKKLIRQKGSGGARHGRLKAGDRKVLFVLPANSENIYLSSRNIPYVNVITVDEINTYTIMNAHSMVMVDGVQDILESRIK